MDSNRFILRNLFRAILWLVAFLVVYIVFKRFIKVDFLDWFEPLFENEGVMFVIFLVSEIIIGIIPPEVFMLWALRYSVFSQFVLVVFSLSVISYFAGVFGFFFGRYLKSTKFYRYVRVKFLRRTERRFGQFGVYLIIVASLTPLPFSGVAMLVGSVNYPIQKYLLFSLTRFLRFAVYAWIFWETRTLVV